MADAWQRRGIGTVLLNELTRRAREEGIRRFSALTLSDNHAVIDMLERLGPVRVHGYEAGAVQLEVELPDLGLTPALKETLRAAGRGELHVRGRG